MFSPPLAVVVGLKADGVAEAGNVVGVGVGVYMAHSAREEAFLFEIVSADATTTTVCFELRFFYSEASCMCQTISDLWLLW